MGSEFVKICHEHVTRLKIFCMVGFIDLLGPLQWLGLFSLVAEAMEVKFTIMYIYMKFIYLFYIHR